MHRDVDNLPNVTQLEVMGPGFKPQRSGFRTPRRQGQHLMCFYPSHLALG